MIVHTQSHEQMVLEARKELQTLRNHLVAPIRRLRREHAFDPQVELVHMYPWTSSARNNWLVVLRCEKGVVSTFSLIRYEAVDGRFAALWITGRGHAYHIDADVIDQFAAYTDESESPLERVQSFFFENHSYAMRVEEPQGEHHWNVSIGAGQGLGLGEWDTRTDIVHWRSFIHHQRLSFQGSVATGSSDFVRQWSAMGPTQQQDLYMHALRIEAACKNGGAPKEGRAA